MKFYEFLNEKATSPYLSFSRFLQQKDINVTKSSRHGAHIRAVLGQDDDIQNTIDDLVGSNIIDVEDSDISKSGKFNTFVFKFKEDFLDIEAGTEIYVVNNAPQGKSTIRKKELTPDNLGLTGDPLRPKPFSLYKEEVQSAINSHVKNPDLKTALIHILEVSAGKEEYNPDVLKGFSNEDLAQIANDFGEISGAIFMAASLDQDEEFGIVKYIKFPEASNEPLIDYYIVCEIDGVETDVAVSAKSKKGAVPSIKAIIPKVAEIVTKTEGDIQAAAQTILRIGELSVVDGIIEGCKILSKEFNSCPGFDELVKLMGTETFDKFDINERLSEYETKEDLLEALEPFYTATGRRPNRATYDRILQQSNPRLYGLVTSPLAYHMADVMNSLKVFEDVLDLIMKELDVNQLHMYLTRKKLEYEIKVFKDYTFKWDPGILSAMNPDNKKMGFKIGLPKTIEKSVDFCC